MHDELGYYYLARARDPRVRVYVRNGENDIEFRLWRQDYPQVWEDHGWVPHEILSKASQLYRAERNPDANPLKLYDMAIAKSLLSGGSD